MASIRQRAEAAVHEALQNIYGGFYASLPHPSGGLSQKIVSHFADVEKLLEAARLAQGNIRQAIGAEDPGAQRWLEEKLKQAIALFDEEEGRQ